MDTLIKAIRNELKFNQEQFAASLGTTVGTINRWENGKTLPNASMQKNLVEFCRREKIESFVCEQIIESYKHTSEIDDLILYHGSKNGITGEIAPIGRKETDFGRGFYMGTDVMQIFLKYESVFYYHICTFIMILLVSIQNRYSAILSSAKMKL